MKTANYRKVSFRDPHSSHRLWRWLLTEEYFVILLFCFLFCTVVLAIFAQNVISLDKAIKEVSEYLIDIIPENSSVAVTNFGAPSVVISNYIIDDITKYIVNSRKFSVVDRQYLENAHKELDFNMSGEVSDETAQKIGRFVAAQIVLFGTIEPVGNMYRMQMRVISVETARIIGIETKNIQSRDMERLFAARIEKPPKPPKPPKPERKPVNRTPIDWKPINWEPLLMVLPDTLSIGSSFTTPGLILSAYKRFGNEDWVLFGDYGCDFGFIHGTPRDIEIKDVSYYSFYPFVNFGIQIPGDEFNFYGKLGLGYMFANYKFPNETVHVNTLAFDVGIGFYILRFIDIGYTIRTNFKGINHKVSVGFTFTALKDLI